MRTWQPAARRSMQGLTWSPGPRSAFGDLVLVLFLLAQVLDGALTYLGVMTFGPSIEANPLIRWLMASIGEGPALAGAKAFAGMLGIVLHVIAVHRIIAILTLLYFGAAVGPWTMLLAF